MSLNIVKAHRIALILFIMSGIGICFAGFYLWLAHSFSSESQQMRHAEAFLSNLLQGNEADTLAYTSARLSAYAANCPNGQLTACVSAIIPPTWGQVEGLHFGMGDTADKRILYYTTWSRLSGDLIPIVVEMRLENNQWRVDSFWGIHPN